MVFRLHEESSAVTTLLNFVLPAKVCLCTPDPGSLNSEMCRIHNECRNLVLPAFPIHSTEHLANSSFYPRYVFCELLTTNEQTESYCTVANLSLNLYIEH